MCGRFVSEFSIEELLLVAHEVAEQVECRVAEGQRNYNACPTQSLPVIVPTAGGAVSITDLTWGLEPAWSARDKTPSLLINARAETAAEKPTFRRMAAEGRCVVPMNGYYEWQRRSTSVKTPYFIHGSGGPLLAGALWRSTDQSGGVFVIVTRPAPSEVRHIHDRAPLVLGAHGAAEWLESPHWPDIEALCAGGPRLEAREVSRRVNSTRNNDEGLLDPVESGD